MGVIEQAISLLESEIAKYQKAVLALKDIDIPIIEQPKPVDIVTPNEQVKKIELKQRATFTKDDTVKYDLTTEAKCFEFLEKQRWPNGIVCPHCGTGKHPYNIKTRSRIFSMPSYRCSERYCDLPFTVRTGSIFDSSKVPIKKWLMLFSLVANNQSNNSMEVARRIETTQKTAWYMTDKIKDMIRRSAPQLLSTP